MQYYILKFGFAYGKKQQQHAHNAIKKSIQLLIFLCSNSLGDFNITFIIKKFEDPN